MRQAARSRGPIGLDIGTQFGEGHPGRRPRRPHRSPPWPRRPRPGAGPASAAADDAAPVTVLTVSTAPVGAAGRAARSAASRPASAGTVVPTRLIGPKPSSSSGQEAVGDSAPRSAAMLRAASTVPPTSARPGKPPATPALTPRRGTRARPPRPARAAGRCRPRRRPDRPRPRPRRCRPVGQPGADRVRLGRDRRHHEQGRLVRHVSDSPAATPAGAAVASSGGSARRPAAADRDEAGRCGSRAGPASRPLRCGRGPGRLGAADAVPAVGRTGPARLGSVARRLRPARVRSAGVRSARGSVGVGAGRAGRAPGWVVSAGASAVPSCARPCNLSLRSRPRDQRRASGGERPRSRRPRRCRPARLNGISPSPPPATKASISTVSEWAKALARSRSGIRSWIVASTASLAMPLTRR